MKGFNKQKKHLKKIREERSLRIQEGNDEGSNESVISSSNDTVTLDSEVQCNINKKADPICCAMAPLASGGTFTSSSKFWSHMNQPFVCKSSFYKGQKIVAQEVKQYALESMQKARDQLPDNVYLCGDGRYPIRRNSHHCSYDVIDSATNKVVSFGIVDKCSNFHPDESFHLTSNMLESEAMRRSFKDLQDVKAKVNGFTVDGDNKNMKILEDEGLDELQKRDPNHLSVCFNKYLVTELALNKCMIPVIGDCFFGLRDKIKNWLGFLIHSNYDPNIKKYAWSTTVNHLLGDNDGCLPHTPTDFIWITGHEFPIVAKKLHEILEKKENDFDLVSFECNTNLNESFHREQLVYSPKNVYFPVSQETRDYMVILRHNEEHLFELELRNRLLK